MLVGSLPFQAIQEQQKLMSKVQAAKEAESSSSSSGQPPAGDRADRWVRVIYQISYYVKIIQYIHVFCDKFINVISKIWK